MYWGLAYGVSAGLIMFLVNLLSQYIGLLWAPVFLAGLAWGGYRNYQKQKKAVGGIATGTPMQEFRQAVSDIADVSQEVFNQEAPAQTDEEVLIDESQLPPAQQPPLPPGSTPETPQTPQQ